MCRNFLNMKFLKMAINISVMTEIFYINKYNTNFVLYLFYKT